MTGAVWVFESDAPLDAFQARLVQGLQGRGFRTVPAKAHDLAFERSGVRLFASFAYTQAGIEMRVKTKAGLLQDARAHEEELWRIARQTQIALAKPPA